MELFFQLDSMTGNYVFFPIAALFHFSKFGCSSFQKFFFLLLIQYLPCFNKLHLLSIMENQYIDFYGANYSFDDSQIYLSDFQAEFRDSVHDLSPCQPILFSYPAADNRTADTANQTCTSHNPQQNSINQVKTCQKIETSKVKSLTRDSIYHRSVPKTVNHNKFFKNKTLGFLRILQNTKSLSREEIQILNNYQRDSNSEQSKDRLLSTKSMREKCENFYNSSTFVASVLISETCFERKIQLIRGLCRAGKVKQMKGKKKQSTQKEKETRNCQQEE